MGAGSLVTRLANSKAELVSPARRALLTVRQGVEELQNPVTAGRRFAVFLGLMC